MTPPTPQDAWAGFQAPGKMSECRHTPTYVEDSRGVPAPSAFGSRGRTPPKRLETPSAPPPFGHLAGRLPFAIAPASARSRPTRHSGLALRPVPCVALTPAECPNGSIGNFRDCGAPEIEGSTVLHRAFRPSQPNTARSHESAQGPAFAAWHRQKVRIPESRRFGAWPGERSDRIALTI
jgi:hypothetical protein